MKLSRQGRHSGGVLCLIRTELLPYVKEVIIEYANFLCFIVDKNLFGLDKNVLLLCAYIPPENSPYYLYTDFENGIDFLEEVLVDNFLCKDELYALLCGDLNSRTADKVPDVDLDDAVYSFTLQQDTHEAVSRQSQDKEMNYYGKLLLNVCAAMGFTILNGFCCGDEVGRFTYVADNGNSVNDYFLVSDNFLPVICGYCRLFVSERLESDHLPLEFSIKMPRDNPCLSILSHKTQSVEKIIWDPDYAHHFAELLNSEESQLKLMYAIEHIDVNVNEALKLFNDFLKENALYMTKRIYFGIKKKKNDWFDSECIDARKHVRKLLTKFCRTLNKGDRVTYCKAKREYKNLLHRKKKEMKETLLHKLTSSVNNQQEFWETIHKIAPRKITVRNNITTEDWFLHFKNVLESHSNIMAVSSSADDGFDFEQNSEDWLDQPISKQEVLTALSKIKNSKAAGPDGIVGELLKFSGSSVVDFLVKFYNALFDQGIYPEQWTESIIFPLFKKGNANDPNNYRGISLCDISSKIYSSIINSRLQKWIEENNTTDEYQAGFKKGYSTIDHAFTLLAAVQKQLVNNRKLYVAFIDFEKAFDSVSRNLLWPILVKNGIKGKLFRCIRSMYDNVKARVRSGVDVTDYIMCSRGVKQGDVCSPVLFSLFINELALEIIHNGKHGITLSPDLIELFILLFADDIILLSETAVGLQNQLNSLYRAASQLELKVNMDKSNIIVFRKGGFLASRERWIYGSLEMTVVNSYKYLGICFSTKLSFKLACEDLVCKAKKVLLRILSILFKLECNSSQLYFKMFDAQVQPVVQYGAEIWGLSSSAQNIERVHLFALKKFLGVESRTPNDFVYGDLGRYPIYLNSYVKCISYWLKLLRMEKYRLPYKAYKMLYNLDERGKHTWVTDVRTVLCRYGYAFVWNGQGVGCINSFLKDFKQRIIDCRWQEWNEHVETSERFYFYRTFKTNKDVEPYVLANVNRFVKFALSRFRFGISAIAVHALRFKSTNACDLLCPLCKTSTEDEVHFIFCCPAYQDIRERFIPRKFSQYPCTFRLSLLLASTNDSILWKLCMYLYLAFKRRSIVCD